ncbi:uncharacterized protein LOC129288301 [Prosopis cineraria]|uniref:uncharacterized protein LOC129288301 n=1 Tax=Prosopis cineraria TaxID=364024 RepID=UPI00240EA74F|nr:uncharacterized protein LOC129288301 [Prosopis cineraria]
MEKIVAEEGGETENEIAFNSLRRICENLKQLEELEIVSCGVEEIVANEDGYTLECPSLKILNVGQCESLQIFAFGQLDSHLLRGDYVDLRSIQILRLQYFQETPIYFPNDLIEKFSATATFQVCCSSFETLFPSEVTGHCSTESPTQIKKLRPFQLEKLEHLWNDDSVSHPLAQNLQYLSIQECSRLTRLAPPSTSFITSFINLTTLEVNECNGLMYFMTTFTAKSLVHLTNLTISNCGMLEEVAFIFPSLVALKVAGCHKMQNFSSGVIVAPFLKLVEVDNGKKRWKEDLNTTVKKFFIDKAVREWKEGNCLESSTNTTNSSQARERTVSATEALSSEKKVGIPKPNHIADHEKLEINKLPSLSRGKEQKEKSWLGIERPQAQVTQNGSSSSTIQDAAIGTQGMHETIEGPLVESTQNTLSLPTIHDAESHDSRTRRRENLFNQPLTFVTGNKKETIGTREIHDTIDKLLIQTGQGAKILATEQNKEIEPSPSQAPQPMTSSALALNAYSNYKGMIDISEKNMLYLEARVKRHPRVLNWLNTKRRRVFASSFFSLFSEATRILRTTQRGHLMEDD